MKLSRPKSFTEALGRPQGSWGGTFLCLKDFDRRDSAILKALAIAAIVFHNFFHLVIPVHENEFSFDSARFPAFLEYLSHPSTALQALFAFYGHFGVQIFIFLSAYGLTKTHWDDSESWWSFMWSRVKKLYPMVTLAVLVWLLLAAIVVGPATVIRDSGLETLLMWAGVSTIVPGMGLPPIGPWWFIPFIVQFYAIWPLLRKLTAKFGWSALVALSVICLLVTLVANPMLAHWDVNLAMTPLGRMRVIALGIIAARYPIRLKANISIPALAIVILGSEYSPLVPFTSLAATVFSLWLYGKLRILLRRSSMLEKIGNHSLAIFLLNGIVRVPFISVARTPLLQFSMAFASALVTFAVSVFFHHLLDRMRGSEFGLQIQRPERPDLVGVGAD